VLPLFWFGFFSVFSGQTVLNMTGTQRLWNASIITNMYWQGSVQISLFVNGTFGLVRDSVFKIDTTNGVFNYNAAG
jgi:hypothetical protein